MKKSGLETVDDILRKHGVRPLGELKPPASKRRKDDEDLDKSVNKRKIKYHDEEDEDDYEDDYKPRRKSRKIKKEIENYSDDEVSSDEEETNEHNPSIAIRRKCKKNLDKEGVKLIKSLLTFCPKRADSEQIWQHIKKCITLPAVQLYTKDAVMTYLKRQGILE